MSNNIELSRGLDVPVKGAADLKVRKTFIPDVVAVKPTDFKGFTPRLLVKEGDKVMAGSPVMADKAHTGILLTSPVSGTDRRRALSAINAAPRGPEALRQAPPVGSRHGQ